MYLRSLKSVSDREKNRAFFCVKLNRMNSWNRFVSLWKHVNTLKCKGWANISQWIELIVNDKSPLYSVINRSVFVYPPNKGEFYLPFLAFLLKKDFLTADKSHDFPIEELLCYKSHNGQTVKNHKFKWVNISGPVYSLHY